MKDERLANEIAREGKLHRCCCQNCGSPILSKAEKVLEIIQERPGIRTKELTVAYELRHGKVGGPRGIWKALEQLRDEGKVICPRMGFYYPRRDL